LKKSFDRVARIYQPLEYLLLGRTLERARFAHLEHLREARDVLILGEGDGRLLLQLLNIAPQCRVDVVERSEQMLRRAQARVNSRRVQWLHADASQPEWAARISSPKDAIVTAFFLDCFSNTKLEALIGRLHRQLRPDGLWLNIDFAIPASGWRRWHARLWVASLYLAFGALTDIDAHTLVDPSKHLRALGMRREHHEGLRADLVFSEVWRKQG
jgi:ubiquinone/menaquinone biosynthesis C-methylase UbiE